jgi:hypothetical protein
MQITSRGGFWPLFDTVKATPPSTAEQAAKRQQVFDAAKALSRGDYGPARAVLAETYA